jgi:hypothetical protein
MYMHVRVYICVCMYNVYIHIYVRVCAWMYNVYVCVCVCASTTPTWRRAPGEAWAASPNSTTRGPWYWVHCTLASWRPTLPAAAISEACREEGRPLVNSR